MHHAYSYIFHLVNKWLVALLGPPGEAWLRYMWSDSERALGYWVPDHVLMAVLVVLVVAGLLIPVSRRLSVEAPGKLQQMLELVLTGLHSLIEDVVGHGMGKRFLPFITGLAVFIFVSNIFGLFFFIQPPTANPSTTFALSITAFIFYNLIGLRDNGLFKYLAHFAGPLPILAPIMVPIEIISHLARILSLALRLFGNIFGEHTAAGIFFAMFPFVVPWPMMGLGIFGSLLQAFIFIMLTMAYLQGAVAHQEH